jgi:F0F1-type ATP synthase membrane subunit c/vacuolar-type H+-ATPase subunit K
MTKAWNLLALLLVLAALCGDLFAQDKQAAETQPQGGQVEATNPWAKAVSVIGACLGAALAAAGGGYGVARIGSGCIESIARQPEAARDMFAPMVVAAGMVEVGMLFAIVVCLFSLF